MKFHKAESYQYIIYSVIKTKIIKNCNLTIGSFLLVVNVSSMNKMSSVTNIMYLFPSAQ